MINLLLISLAISLGVYFFLKWVTRNNDVFEKQGIKYAKPFPLIGNSWYMFTGDFIGSIQKVYSMFPDEKIIGMFEFVKPIYLLRSPHVIKQLTVKDFSHFQDHQTFVSSDADDVFGNVLFSMKGKKWRDMRCSLSPMFTGKKMRVMLDLITKCSEQLCEYIREDYEQNGPTAHPMKLLFSKYASDVIATCAFGVEVNSLKFPDNDIYKIAQTIMGDSATGKITYRQIAKFLMLRLFPRISKILKLKLIPNDVKHKFSDLIIHTMEVRKRENIQRPDLLKMLMKLKDGQLSKESEIDEIDPENKMINGEFKTNWTDNELIAQAFQFFLPGFHGTSTILSFCSYALAVNADLQEKLITEIDETYDRLDGKPLSYEIITTMKYMDMFISEVLRMWPPGIIADRECRETYNYEDEDGLKFTIKEGDIIYIPTYALHMDPKYFPNPEKFDPDRFSDENRPNINIHAYLPFGVGPRNCIAFRFALMEMKAMIFHLLLNFRLVVCKETEIPLEIVMAVFGLVHKNEIQLQIIPREDKKKL